MLAAILGASMAAGEVIGYVIFYLASDQPPSLRHPEAVPCTVGRPRRRSTIMVIGMVAGLRNARLDAITTFAGNSGKLRIYDGSRPATGGTATTLLAELTVNSTFAPSASGGTLTLNAITGDTAADATGTATWARLLKSDGTTIVMDMSVGTSGQDVNLNTVSIVANAAVNITSAVLTEGNA